MKPLYVLLAAGLLLAGCQQAGPASPGHPPSGGVCTADYGFPSLTIAAPTEAGTGVYLVQAPSVLTVSSDGRYGSSSCPAYLSSMKLLVNGTPVASQSRSLVNGAQPAPFVFTWTLQPGQGAVPGTGQATLSVQVAGTDAGNTVVSLPATVRVTALSSQ